MAKYQDSIEINGKLYNLQGEVKPVAVASNDFSPKSNQVIDGFVRPKPQTVISPSSTMQTTVKAKPVTPRATGASTKHRQQQRSNILMRKSVKKPLRTEKAPEIKSHGLKINDRINSHNANRTQKSPYIRKFNPGHKQIQPQIKPLAVVVPPKKISNPQRPNSLATNEINATSNPPKTADLFTNALNSTTTTAQAKPIKPKKNRALLWSSLSLVTAMTVGIFIYLNFPVLKFKFAGMQAGFAASIPSYKPDGYAIKGPIGFEAGKVSIGFKSNTDERAYTVKQEVSNWNSQSLVANFLDAQNKQYTTEQSEGRTIYYYDDGSATWVNGGVWYQIISKSLSSDQLMSIANSL